MPTPAIRIDLDIDEPLHEQIFAQLCNMIEIGGLTQGARLPTVRDLARNLRIAPNTVVHAYARLQEYGLVFSDGRRGTIVAGPSALLHAGRARSAALNAALEAVAERFRARGCSAEDIAGAMDAQAGRLRRNGSG